MAKIGYGMRSSHGTSGGRGTWGPASQCHLPPPNVGGLRQAVLAITWQSFPSTGSMAARMAGWATARWARADRLSIS